MKKTTLFLFLAILACSPHTILSHAKTATCESEQTAPYQIKTLDDGSYFETIITDGISIYASNQITRTKTTTYKNSSGVALWSASIRATFTYDGNTATCTSCSHGYNIYNSTWSVASISSSKSGNSATTYVTAVRTMHSGANQTVNKSITIQCSPNGTVS